MSTDPYTIAPWAQTASGLAVDLLDPKPEQITLHDIALSLSRLPRFNGHTCDRVWSVAEHSLLVADLVSVTVPDAPPALLLAALLHDAHEAYVGDRIAPVKAATRAWCAQRGDYSADPFSAIAKGLDGAIHTAFAIAPSDIDLQVIHHADLQALGIEARLYMAPPPRPWIDLPEPPPGFITNYPPRTWRDANSNFTIRALTYIERRHGLRRNPLAIPATPEAPQC
jgi:hypothetical protein